MNNALVIGGRKGFGRFGVNILMGLTEKDGVKPFDNVYVSSTSLDGISEINSRLNPQLKGVKISPYFYGNPANEEIQKIINENEISFVYDSSQDPTIGDTIHLVHAMSVLGLGVKFMSEKPFANTNLFGSDCFFRNFYFEYTKNRKNLKQLISMELPLASLSKSIEESCLLDDAKDVQFFWNTKKPNSTKRKISIIDNLLLHPLSLLSDEELFLSSQVLYNEDSAKIGFANKSGLNFSVSLGYGSNFRGMQINGKYFAVRDFKENGELYCSMFELPVKILENAMAYEGPGKQILPSVANPLKQSLVRAIQGKPIIDSDRAVSLQYILNETVQMLNYE